MQRTEIPGSDGDSGEDLSSEPPEGIIDSGGAYPAQFLEGGVES